MASVGNRWESTKVNLRRLRNRLVTPLSDVEKLRLAFDIPSSEEEEESSSSASGLAATQVSERHSTGIMTNVFRGTKNLHGLDIHTEYQITEELGSALL